MPPSSGLFSTPAAMSWPAGRCLSPAVDRRWIAATRVELLLTIVPTWCVLQARMRLLVSQTLSGAASVVPKAKFPGREQ
jgi:hypothetical protein